MLFQADSQKPCKVDVQEDTYVKNSHLKDTTGIQDMNSTLSYGYK